MGFRFELILLGVLFYVFAWSPLQTILFPTSKSDIASYQSFQRSDKLIIPDDDLQCPSHSYSTYIASIEPLVIYIENFLSESESSHIVQLGEQNYVKSTVFTGEKESFDPTIRNSSKALLPRDNVVQCLEQRAREFQGWKKDIYIERLWAQKYETGGHYTYHYDWSGDLTTRSGGRLSTFMVYLGANCEGGGTIFPRLDKPHGGRWCEFVDCHAEGEGVVFRPRQGAAVFWQNFDVHGKGYEETWHAALPVTKGSKVGLNIWSWWQPGYEDAIKRQEQDAKLAKVKPALNEGSHAEL